MCGQSVYILYINPYLGMFEISPNLKNNLKMN